MNKRKVAVYVRVSTEHEAQISALGNQVQYYDNLFSSHPEWELYDKYIDESKSRTEGSKKKPEILKKFQRVYPKEKQSVV